VRQSDVCCLPLKDLSIKSVVCDLPFMWNPHGTALTHNEANGRFGMFKTWTELEETYKGALDEFRRVLKPKGIACVKSQDYTDTKATLTHCLLYQWAIEREFYAKDFFVLYRNHGPVYNIYKVQRHARKFHSYWLVLERRK
jgi:tRNA G10  N-methylase Trm11